MKRNCEEHKCFEKYDIYFIVIWKQLTQIDWWMAEETPLAETL